jgi:hypothetical protein
MKRVFLASVAALFLTTGTAHAVYDDCAVVLRTPDGFLALREKPSAKSKIILKLQRSEVLNLNKNTLRFMGQEKKSKQWIAASVVRYFEDGEEDFDGYVSRKYIQQFKCPDAAPELREKYNTTLPVEPQKDPYTPVPGVSPPEKLLTPIEETPVK